MSPEPFAIVTGMEHSGTTYLSELLKTNSSNRLGGAFECGILLTRDSPRNFREVSPFFDWLCHPVTSGHWGLTTKDREYVCDTHSWSEFYRRLKTISCVTKYAEHILDKTPAYCYQLSSIIEKSSNAPVFVTFKTTVSQYKSYRSRGVPIDRFETRYRAFRKSLEKALSLFPDRVSLIAHNRLCSDPTRVVKSLLDLLGLTLEDDFNEELNWTVLPALDPDHSIKLASEPLNSDFNETEIQVLETLKSDYPPLVSRY